MRGIVAEDVIERAGASMRARLAARPDLAERLAAATGA
jgi:hypothetical protein